MVVQTKRLDISFEKEYMFIDTGIEQYKVKISDVSHKLASASDNSRQNYTISSSGYGIHWEQLDEDLSVNGLIKQAVK